MAYDLRPYLVIPKLIEQPTWGGTYIVETKAWQGRPGFSGKKIGQSYELFAKSNLSFALSSIDASFTGEMTDPKQVAGKTTVADAVSLEDLIVQDPTSVLGAGIVKKYGPVMPLLLKFTQALGNSFQLHVKDGVQDAQWKPKPESWYFFEPGLITLGVKPDTDWGKYQDAVTHLQEKIAAIASEVQTGTKQYGKAKQEIDTLVKTYNPWQYVNVLPVPAKTLIDLSPCGIHHSWEEDSSQAPLGNVVYEIQLDVMDDVSTIRNFDKGKMDASGKIRQIQIDDYFRFIDRTPEANNPETHMRKATVITGTDTYCHERLLESKYYTMDKVKLKTQGAEFSETVDSFRHVFAKSGSVRITANGTDLTLTTGHSAFIPAGVKTYTVVALEPKATILISY